MDYSALQAAKLWLAGSTGLAKDALHVHVGLIIFFAAALLFRWPLRSWKPWAAALAATLAGEAWDLWDSFADGRRIIPSGNWKDLWNTMLWPTMILLLARTTRLFQFRSKR